MTFDPFEDVTIGSVTDSGMHQLSELCRRQIKQEDEVKFLEEKLKEAKAQLRRTSEELIPTAMAEMGISSIELDNGEKVSIKPEVAVHIADRNKDAAFKWLRDNEHDGIIKNNVTASFGRGEDDLAKEFLERCDNEGLVVSHKESVHTQTLKAFVKEVLSAGEDIPVDLFGIHEYNKTTIKRRKG